VEFHSLLQQAVIEKQFVKFPSYNVASKDAKRKMYGISLTAVFALTHLPEARDK
jgi:hypothetical protein